MERAEIEQLLAEYATGEVSDEKKLRLSEMFLKDPFLKEEANTVAFAWEALNHETSQHATEKMDKQFYTMLQDVKAKNKLKPMPIIALKRSWLKLAIASAACIVGFIVGRSSIKPIETIRFKTVYVKPSTTYAVGDKQPTQVLMKPVSKRPPKSRSVSQYHPEFDRKIRSLYASERITAVLSITEKSNLSAEDLQLLELALKEDPSSSVRLAVIDGVRPLIAQTKVQGVLISAINSQTDTWIQESIVDLLLEHKSKEAIPYLLTLLENKTTTSLVQHKIKEGIETFLN